MPSPVNLKPVRRKASMTDPRHLMRFLKSQLPHATPEEIAKSEGVSVATVKESIQRIEVYRTKTTPMELELALRDLVIDTVPQAKETLRGLLMATELIEVPNKKTGKTEVIESEDKTTRLEAMRVVSSLVTAVLPKAPLIAQQVNQNTILPATVSKSETTEERFKRLREQAQQHNLLPPSVAAVPEYIDAGEEANFDDDDDDEDDEDDDAENE